MIWAEAEFPPTAPKSQANLSLRQPVTRISQRHPLKYSGSCVLHNKAWDQRHMVENKMCILQRCWAMTTWLFIGHLNSTVSPIVVYDGAFLLYEAKVGKGIQVSFCQPAAIPRGKAGFYFLSFFFPKGPRVCCLYPTT